MHYPKVLLKKRKYVSHRWGDINETESETYIFRDAKFENFMYRVARALRFVYPRAAVDTIRDARKHIYFAKRRTEDNVNVIEVEFREPYSDLDHRTLRFVFMPTVDIVHVSTGWWDDKNAVIYKGKMVVLNQADYRQLTQFFPTKWMDVKDDKRTVKFPEMFEAYCNHNPTMEIQEED